MSDSIRALLFQHGQALLRAGRAPDAMEAFAKSLQEVGGIPTTASIALALAEAAEGAGSPERSIRTLLTYAGQCSELSDELLLRAAQTLSRMPQLATLFAPMLDAELRWLLPENPSPGDLRRMLLAADIYAFAMTPSRAFEVLKRAEGAVSSDAERSELIEKMYLLAESLNTASNLFQSRDVLDRISAFAPEDIKSRWLRCEVLRQLSYPENDPELQRQGVAVGEERLSEALRVWDEAVARIAPTAGIEAWVLCSRSLINEQRVRLPQADKWRLGWEAIIYAQRAVQARGYDEVFDCSLLARLFRLVGLTACELELTRRALDLAHSKEEKRTATDERIIATTNYGDFVLALQLLGDFEPSAWRDAIEAYIFARQDKPKEALVLVERAIAAGYRDPWCIELRADCYRWTGDHDRFWQECEAIRSQTPSTDVDGALTRAKASFWLGLRSGDFSEVSALFGSDHEKMNLPTGLWMAQLASFVALARGHLHQGVERLRQLVDLTVSKRDLDDLRRDLQYIGERHPDAKMGRAIRDCAELGECIASRMATLDTKPLTPEAELTHHLSKRPTDDANGFLWIGAQATLARFDFWAERFESAATRYASLIERAAGSFPEAQRALNECGNTLLGQADEAARHEGATQYNLIEHRVYQFLADQALMDRDIRADAWIALALSYALGGNKQAAQAAFHAALKCYGADSSATPTQLAERLRFLVQQPPDFWKVWDMLATVVPSEPERLALQSEMLEWFSSRFSSPLRADEVPRLPLILELGHELIPPDAPAKYREWVLFQQYLPDLREWFSRHYGMTIPWVHVRGRADLAADGYAILINDVPARLPRAAVPRGEPLSLIVERMRTVLLHHLDEFLDLDSMELMITEYGNSPDGKGAEVKELVEEVLPSRATRFYFSRLLRALVQQGVPLSNLGEILRSVRGLPLHSAALNAAIKTVRLRLRSRLPGNAVGWHQLPLPPDVVTSIHHAMSHRDDGASAERVASEIRNILSPVAAEQKVAGIALRTPRYDTAEFLRNFLRAEFWDVTALCDEEVYEPVPATLAATA